MSFCRLSCVLLITSSVLLLAAEDSSPKLTGYDSAAYQKYYLALMEDAGKQMRAKAAQLSAAFEAEKKLYVSLKALQAFPDKAKDAAERMAASQAKGKQLSADLKETQANYKLLLAAYHKMKAAKDEKELFAALGVAQGEGDEKWEMTMAMGKVQSLSFDGVVTLGETDFSKGKGPATVAGVDATKITVGKEVSIGPVVTRGGKANAGGRRQYGFLPIPGAREYGRAYVKDGLFVFDRKIGVALPPPKIVIDAEEIHRIDRSLRRQAQRSSRR